MNGGEFILGLPSFETYAGLVRACSRVRRPRPTREVALRLHAILTPPPPPLADMHVRMLKFLVSGLGVLAGFGVLIRPGASFDTLWVDTAPAPLTM